LDDEAAAARAKEIAALEAMKQEALREDRVRNAAPVLLAALKSAKHMLERDPIDAAKMAVITKCGDALMEATGEDE
jgi:hypothetical protein